MKMRPSEFQSKDIDLICYLRFKGFKPLSNPIEDSSGTRWIVFSKTKELESAIVSFYTGTPESELLNEFRKTRSFLLDTPTRKGEREWKTKNTTHP